MPIEFEKRCQELIVRGFQFISQPYIDDYKPTYWYKKKDVAVIQAWIASVVNFFQLTAIPETYFWQECNRIITDKELGTGVPYHTVQKLLGLLQSIQEEMQQGLMKRAEYIFVATTFDDFLDHAGEFHKSNKKIESSVLASTVFEDSIRKYSEKNNIEQAGKSIELIIDELAKQGAVTPVKSKRWKSFAGLRNKALHAQWDDFDIKDVGEMIKGTQEIIEML